MYICWYLITNLSQIESFSLVSLLFPLVNILLGSLHFAPPQKRRRQVAPRACSSTTTTSPEVKKPLVQHVQWSDQACLLGIFKLFGKAF
ncbi:hypothetical protein P9112_013222 [Eukaryota sp. TZLM1-RC]